MSNIQVAYICAAAMFASSDDGVQQVGLWTFLGTTGAWLAIQVLGI